MAVSPVQADQPGDVSADGRVQVLQYENQLLFNQLHIVQTELERLYYQGKVQTVPSTIIHLAPVHNLLVEKQAEILRCEALVKAQDHAYLLQAQAALASQLGEILIQGTRSAGSMLSLPTRLLKVWRQNKRVTPPKALGGEQFGRVIDVFKNGGEDAVEALLTQSSISTKMQASAWTALARGQMQTNAAAAVKFARRAYSLEPRPFRQKWLAFRLHEAGELLEAEALTALLPDGVKFSDSEERQLLRLNDEAKLERLVHARKSLGHADHESEVRRQWQELAASRDQLAVQVAFQASQLIAAQEMVSKLQQEKVAMVLTAQEQQQTLVLAQSSVSKLQQENAAMVLTAQEEQQPLVLAQSLVRKLQQEKAAMVLTAQEERQSLIRAQSLVASLQKECKELRTLVRQWFEQCTTLQFGVAELTDARNEQTRLAAELLAERELLKRELSEPGKKQHERIVPRNRKRNRGRKK